MFVQVVYTTQYIHGCLPPGGPKIEGGTRENLLRLIKNWKFRCDGGA